MKDELYHSAISHVNPDQICEKVAKRTTTCMNSHSYRGLFFPSKPYSEPAKETNPASTAAFSTASILSGGALAIV